VSFFDTLLVDVDISKLAILVLTSGIFVLLCKRPSRLFLVRRFVEAAFYRITV
jgi:hypothetical protein